MDWITMSLGLGGGGAILWVLKKIPNDELCYFVETGCEKHESRRHLPSSHTVID